MAIQTTAQAFSAADPVERRQFGRRSIVRHAWILTGAQQRIACCIRDVSDGGAMLELAVPAGLPDRFTLMLEGGANSAVCEVRHKTRSSVGVAFANLQEAARFCALGANSPAKPYSASSAPIAPRRESVAPAKAIDPVLAAKLPTVICLPAFPATAE